MQSKNLLGVVLCGGESKRMGSDKGLMITNGTPWAKQVANKLASLNIPVIISINKQQEAAYSHIFNAHQLIIDDLQIGGPLNGLLTVHGNFKDYDILLMACDMIDMEKPTMDTIIEAYLHDNESDFFVYHHENIDEPFCAIYTARALEAEMKKALAKTLTKFSLHHFFSSNKTRRFAITSAHSFVNYNRL